MNAAACSKCGGDMVGDGYTAVPHCEYATAYDDLEPDADPVYCDFKEADLLAVAEGELADVRRANGKLGEALREIYRLRGEDEEIAQVCNAAFGWVGV